MSLEILSADPLRPLHHGFFTRRGGASSGVFDGLNCGRGSSDQTEIVEINRTRVAEAMGVVRARLVLVEQVHSAHAVTVDGPFEGARPKADALVTSTPGVAVAILTADCAPVLFADREAGVVGAAHAGWRGALDGVLEATLDAMERAGADRARVMAAVGPTISQRHYEVGPEFFDRFYDEDTGNSRYFAKGPGDRLMFDLPAFVTGRLREAGVARAEWTRHCTYSDPARFYSYRRATHERAPDYGRLISAIRL